MSIFKKPSVELVYDLINEANPSLPFPVSAGNVKIGVPAAITPGTEGTTFQNTRTVLTPTVTSTDYIGRNTVRYRRLSLGTLFRGMTVQVEKYSPAVAGGNSSTIVFTVYQLLADLNAKFGLNLTTDDINDANITRGNTQEGGYYTNSVVVTTKATSLGWVGSFTLKWKDAPRDITTVITLTDMAGREYPGGNVFDSNHLEVLDLMTYGVDFTTDVAPILSSTANAVGTLTSTATNYRNVFENIVMPYLNSQYGLGLNYAADIQDKWDYILRTLPHVDWPDANSAAFNRILAYIPKAGNLDYVGKLYVHYNYFA